MSAPIGLTHFLAQTDSVARFVLVFLCLGSVGSWYLIVVKGIHVWLMTSNSRAFLSAFWEAPDLETVAGRMREYMREYGTGEPFAHLLYHGFAAIDRINRSKTDGQRRTASLIEAGAPDEILTRALKRAIDEDRTRLEFGQTFLATVASSAPFVGLFGTVWGIYHALIAIGISGQGTLDKVAGPVGEALVMTGIGLAVAIPAAVAYNIFARANRNTLSRLNSFGYDVFNFLSTGIKESPMRADARVTSEKVIALARSRGHADNEGADPSQPSLALP